MHCSSPQLAACQPSRASCSQQVPLPCSRRSNGYCHHSKHFWSPQGQRLELTRQIPVTRAASADDSRHESGSSGGGSGGVLGLVKKWQQDSKQMQEQLKALGAAGVIAYGLFNTLYYTVAFVVVWFSIANVPSGLGLSAAARKAAEVFALVWAGSQVTKLLRAGAALACAPLIDKGLEKMGLHDKRKAYLGIVLACVALATVVIGVVIALHA